MIAEMINVLQKVCLTMCAVFVDALILKLTSLNDNQASSCNQTNQFIYTQNYYDGIFGNHPIFCHYHCSIQPLLIEAKHCV